MPRPGIGGPILVVEDHPLISTALGATFDGTARPIASVAALAGIAAFLLERSLFRGKA